MLLLRVTPPRQKVKELDFSIQQWNASSTIIFYPPYLVTSLSFDGK